MKLFSFLLLAAGCVWAEDWPGFRGPTRQGISGERNLPVKWSPAEGVLWKTAVPGQGWSSPVVWRDHVFLTTATEGGASCRLLAFDARNGRIRWNTELVRQATKRKHPNNSYATPTPATDGKLVYAVCGDGAFAAADFEGRVAWVYRDYPHHSEHGLGASPILFNGLLIMPRDGSSDQGDGKVGWQIPWEEARIVALDAPTGRLRWTGRRGLSQVAHVTPNLAPVEGGYQLVSGAGNVVQGFDPATGRRLWSAPSPGEGVVPSVVVGGGLVFTVSGFGKPTIRAHRLGGELAWEQTRGVPMISSLLYVEPYLYSATAQGIAYCLDARTGEAAGQARIGGSHSASPVWAEGRIYFTSEEGEVTVVETGPAMREIARNQMEGTIRASPAVSGGRIFIRTEQNLYAIGGKRP